MKRPRRNAFNLSYESKLTLNMGELVPIMCMPVVPGDKFRVKTESLVRLAPLVAPMMHRVNVFTHITISHEYKVVFASPSSKCNHSYYFLVETSSYIPFTNLVIPCLS